jgi:ABC-2 type transport system permease protein
MSSVADVPPLKPVEGPSAFGSDFRRFFSLLWVTAMQDFRLQYRTSILGYTWTLLRPLAFFGVLFVVFTQIVPRVSEDVPNYGVLLLMNIMLYQFFADATGTSVTSVVSGESIVRKMHFPRIIIPLGGVLSSAMTSALNVAVVVGFVLASGIDPQPAWVLIVAVAAGLVVYSSGMALLLSMAYVTMRDIGHVWVVVLRVLFYGTPILYPLEMVPESFRWAVVLNPLAPMLYQARVWLIEPDAPSLVELTGVLPLLGSALVVAAVCAGGVWLFVRRAPRVAEAL